MAPLVRWMSQILVVWLGLEPLFSALKAYTAAGAAPQSWRHTATSLPWTVTCSASTRIGA